MGTPVTASSRPCVCRTVNSRRSSWRTGNPPPVELGKLLSFVKISSRHSVRRKADSRALLRSGSVWHELSSAAEIRADGTARDGAATATGRYPKRNQEDINILEPTYRRPDASDV
ncbi:hypothetical protein RRG08_035737 [Elysia crispata]|uniref:Uncharacterized protein n=1 Tax=Elysia crispata TaxID=231223 RepID=A0AAE1CZJ0_9GAST|nr:hypothetical protein RRG08_035737 [Elysia crispata]